MSIWATLIIQHGIPAAAEIFKILKTWNDGKEPTQDDWDKLLKLVGKPLEDYEKKPPGGSA